MWPTLSSRMAEEQNRIRSILPVGGGGWKASASCLTWTGDCRTSTGISATEPCPGHDEDDDDDELDMGGLITATAAAAVALGTLDGPGLDWLSQADVMDCVDVDSVGCESCLSN